ncbi:cytochrome-c peroxidase [Beijerinckia mobilis]|uniref:cytochrome-c peroxidase n=1 Tax=Beijerinckia mobilis TaxID=231434 RepID=UPI00068FFEC9|nr:cytochrome c peroxidase [Beijerinckia mobilis]
MRSFTSLSTFFISILCLQPCGAEEPRETGLSRAIVFEQAKQLSEIGRKMFSDPRLSGSGKLSCASCHDPQNAFSPANDLAVQMGGVNLDVSAFRAAPTLTYKQATPQFTEHYYESDDEGDESVDNGPSGGLTWDGREDRRSGQALIPLLSPLEMANKDHATLSATIEQFYGPELRSVAGNPLAQAKNDYLAVATQALDAYQQESTLFYPFSSKYDTFLQGKVELNAIEKRGLELFEAADKGNCASCHVSRPSKTNTPPFFTDYGMIGIGLPRNRALTQNADPTFYDLGLCGPLRKDFMDHPAYCGLFKTPTLRNVARRKSFFHNGSVKDLRQAVAFYFERDTKPEKWYPQDPNGMVQKYDDLPPAYRENMNNEPPFGKQPGDQPQVSDDDIDAIVTFLKTLNDGYDISQQPASMTR